MSLTDQGSTQQSCTEPSPTEPGLRLDDARELLDQQTQVLELIARAAALPEVLTQLLRGLEHLMPGARCSVLLLNRGRGTLHHGAAPSLPAAYIDAIDGLSVADGAGSCGTAAALNTAVVAEDVHTDPRWVAFRAVAGDAGLRACWSTPVRGRDGMPVATFAVYHDHPHRPSTREELLVDRFTHLVAVAIDHAAVDRHRRARHEAQAARRAAEHHSRAKSELLAALGHEVRTPLQAIVGFAELLGTMDLPDDRRQEALHRINTAAGHVMALLTDVLDISRLEAGALPLTLEPVSVTELVADVFGMLSMAADRRDVELVSQDLHTDLVRADRRRLRQVLLNLVRNSIQHGGGRVEVRTAPASEGDDPAYVTISVDDEGPGIPADVLPTLFTAYARRHPAEQSGTLDEDSVGLGLSLAHALMAAMGGELSVGATSAAGTSMLLRLPRWSDTP